MAKSYKTAIGFLRHLAVISREQDMADCKDWDKLTEPEQRLFYAVLAGIQNDIGEFQTLLDNRNSKIKILNILKTLK